LKIETKFDLGDKVVVDGKGWIVWYVTCIYLRGNNLTYELSRLEGETPVCHFIEEWRIEAYQSE